MNNLPDDEDLSSEEFHLLLDLDKVRANVPIFSTNKLCEMIVAYRYLNFSEESAIICMQELGKRRAEGDDTKFEDIINNMQKELPPLEFQVPSMKSALSQLTNIFKVAK